MYFIHQVGFYIHQAIGLFQVHKAQIAVHIYKNLTWLLLEKELPVLDRLRDIVETVPKGRMLDKEITVLDAGVKYRGKIKVQDTPVRYGCSPHATIDDWMDVGREVIGEVIRSMKFWPKYSRSRRSFRRMIQIKVESVIKEATGNDWRIEHFHQQELHAFLAT